MLGISKSMLMVNLAEMKELGAPVEYDYTNQTYYYSKPCSLKFGFEMQSEEMDRLKGGKNIFEKRCHYNNIRMAFHTFVLQVF